INSFYRGSKFRLRRVETNDLYVILTRHGYQPDKVAADWRQRIRQKVGDESDLIRAYLRWRLEVLRRQMVIKNSPEQVVFWVQNYPIPAPPGRTPWAWEAEDKQPVARWLPFPGTEESGRWHVPLGGVLQTYDPVAGRFVTFEDK